jgi:hypothetical protein
VLSEARSKMDSWEYSLAHLNIPRDLGDAAMAAMTKNVSARMISKSKKSAFFNSLIVLGDLENH